METINNARNLTLMTDLYQLTMMNGYMRYGIQGKTAVFDMFYRTAGPMSAYAICAGLEQVIEYIENLHFAPGDIQYLRSLKIFDEDFLRALEDFRFSGDIDALPEGSIVFPGEPILRVKAPIFEAQFIETALLNMMNHQTLIATRANRVVQAAGGGAILEFGLRRAQGPDAGIYGARAAVIGGCAATSNVLTGELFGIPVRGTHAHSWVMAFESELAAFRAYAEVFPNDCLLLVDTYDTLKSGVPNAIRVFEELRDKGYKPYGIRLDSGDLAFLSREARRMLDEAGFTETKIIASNDLDEELIWDLRAQGARIDVWGVGTKLITSSGMSALGGVYKLAALEEDGALVPKIKISENSAKITNPGVKELYRLYDRNGMAIADLITLADEELDDTQPLTIFDPENTWKRMHLTDYTAKKLLVPVFRGGERVYDCPALGEISGHCQRELGTFWEQYKRLSNPQRYKVDLSQKLYDLKQKLLLEHGHG